MPLHKPSKPAARRLMVALLTALAIGCGALSPAAAPKKGKKKSAPPPTIEQLRKESKTLSKEAKATGKKLDATAAETKRNLRRLGTLNDDLAANRRELASARAVADTLDAGIARLNDTIAALELNLKEMQDAYARSLRRLQQQGNNVSSALAFVFSAESVSQAWRRMRYIKQFSKWRRRKAARLTEAARQLEAQRNKLADMRSRQADAMQRINLANNKIAAQQQETERLVDKLRKEEASLREVMAQQQRRQRELDRSIDKLIAEEQRRQEEARRKAKAEAEAKARAKAEAEAKARAKAEAEAKAGGRPAPAPAKPAKPAKPAAPEKKWQEPAAQAEAALTGSFEANKGRLLFPVAGRYRIARSFGLQQHPQLRHVTTDNSGIDIEAQKGATARAVFKGKVSAIFKQDGYNSIVMVRHGDYISIYAGLSTLNVANGQELKAGQTIGTVYADPDNDNTALLHFELRRERTKLNPIDWLAR